MPPIKIQRISHQTELGPTGGLRKLVRVDFLVGDDGPFNLSFAEDSFDQGAAFLEISKFADKVWALRMGTTPASS